MKAAAGFGAYLTACAWFTLTLADNWSVLAITVLTVTFGVVALGAFLALCALQAQRQRYEFHAWRAQLEPPASRPSIDTTSTIHR